MEYELVENMDGDIFIRKTDVNGIVSMFFANEGNSDYQQYLIDTDGGLSPELPTS